MNRQHGSAMLEFFLAATLVLLPLISGILEFAQLATARQVLAIATSEAARSFAVASMDERSDHLDAELQLLPSRHRFGFHLLADCYRSLVGRSKRARKRRRVSSAGERRLLKWGVPIDCCSRSLTE